MDWEENLAAIIKCTDAHLEQQFQQLGELTAGPSGASALYLHDPGPSADPLGFESGLPLDGDSLASAFLRESLASVPRLGPLQHPRAYTRASGSFSVPYRQRQEHKRAAKGSADNQRAQFTDDNAACYDQSARTSSPPPQQRQPHHHHHHHPQQQQTHPQQQQQLPPAFQTFASPTYDMASMMEQVRLSLKLEVDARAAIAERQLSALLQLCKSTSEELDRLRVEVCAADRQLHTLDQVQAKLRQELTTQKDVGFHLQSLCGKDEAWRMTAESQLLELRQLVAALREQCAATQSGAQDKLSRNELLVHFNAAMEPVKAQMQASTHHQAQQIAEVARSASGSALLLDALSHKLNHGVAGEVADLRGDVAALKTQLSKLAGERIGHQRDSEQHVKKEQEDAAARDQRRERDRQQLQQLVDKARADILAEVAALMSDEAKQSLRKSEETTAGFARRLEVDAAVQRAEESWRAQLASAALQAEKQLKALESQLHSEFGTGLRDLLKQIEQAKLAAAEAARTSDTRADAWDKRLGSLSARLDKEQEDRRQAMDAIQEAIRTVRGDVQQSAHNVAQDARVKHSQTEYEVDKRVREAEKKSEDALDRVHKDVRARFAEMETAVKAIEEKTTAKGEQRVRGLEDAVVKTNAAVAALSLTIGELKAGGSSGFGASKAVSRDAGDREEIRSALEKQTSAFVSAIDTSMQRMQLQLQLQLQTQSQAHMAVHPGHWTIPSTPTAPLLTLPSHLIAPPGTDQRVPAVLPASSALAVVEKSAMENSTGSEMPSSALATSTHPLAESQRSDAAIPTVSSAPIPPLRTPGEELKAKTSGVAPQTLTAVDKIQETISMSARGAMAEAELAKARVETRRKQELELRQQQQQQQQRSPAPVSPLIRGPLAPSPRDSVHAVTSRAPPAPLIRAVSTSALSISGSSPEQPSLQDSVGTSTFGHTRSSSMVNIPETSPPLSSRTQVHEVKLTSTPMKPPDVQGSVPRAPPPPPRQEATIRSTATTDTLPTTGTANVDGPTTANNPVSTHVVPPNVSFPTPAVDTYSAAAVELKEPSQEAVAAPLEETIAPPTTAAQPSPPTTLVDSPSSVMQKLFGHLPRSPPPQPTDKPLQQSVKSFPPPPPPPTDPAPASRANSSSLTAAVSGSVPSGGPTSPAHVLCSHCRLPIRKEQREEHESKQCPRRMVECPTCDAKMLWINLEVHSKSCATQHQRSNTAEQHETPARTPSIISSSRGSLTNDLSEVADSPKKCRHCSVDFPAADLFDHETRCDKVLKQCPHCLRRQKMSELQEHIENCDCRLVPCPNDCGGKFLQRGIEKHLASRCPKKLGEPSSPAPSQGGISRSATVGGSTQPTSNGSAVPGDPARSTSTVPPSPGATPVPLAPQSSSMSEGGALNSCQPPRPTATASASPTVVPPSPTPITSAAPPNGASQQQAECKFCDEEFPANEIDAHELACDWRPKRCQHCNMVIISRDLMRHEASCKTNFKTCQHCNESMAQSALSSHSSRCPKRPIKCIRCCQLFPADSIVAHSTACKYIPGSTASTAIPAAPPVPARLSNPSTSSAALPRTPTGNGSGTTSTTPSSLPSAPRVPPPPPYLPTPTAAPYSPQLTVQSVNETMRARATSVDTSRLGASRDATTTEESAAERMARRSLALTQLMNPGGVTPSSIASGEGTKRNPIGLAQPNANDSGVRLELDEDEDAANAHETGSGSDDEAEDDEVDDEDDGDDDNLTLAQVVAEWTVDNVCVWLHEDVGVPDVVPRFQQQRCNGAMLLELTESDLVNDFGIRNRIHRERILNAIEAVKMSDDDEDEEDDDEDYVEGDEEDDDDTSDAGVLTAQSLGGRHSLAAPTRQAGELLPSSSAMFRRINSALELPKK